MLAPVYLIELEAHTGIEVKKFYLSTQNYTTGPAETPANTPFNPVIADPGNFSVSMFASGRTEGEAEVGYGQIVLSNADGELDVWLDYAFDGRPFKVLKLASDRDPYASAVVMMTGLIESIDSSSIKSFLRLRCYDRRLVLDKPLLKDRFLGTTLGGGPTATGTPDIKDTLIPRVFGWAFFMPATCVNPYDLIYQVSGGAVHSIQVYDGGGPLTVGFDYPDVAELQAAPIPAGHFATCKALGLFRLGWDPYMEVTADVVEGATAAARRPGAIVRRMLELLGLTTSDFSAASMDALDALSPYECGLYIDREETALSSISTILSSVGGYIHPNSLGVFEVGRLEAPAVTSVATITAEDILSDQGASFGVVANPDTDGNVAVEKIIVRYRRVWQPTDGNSLLGCVDADTRTFWKMEWREAVEHDEDVKLRYLHATEKKYDSALKEYDDAKAEALRRLNIYKVPRFVLVGDVDQLTADPIRIGDTVQVVAPIHQFTSGRNMRVIGRAPTLSTYRCTLILWG